MKFEIIDFHTHPFSEAKNNICSHKKFLNMKPEETAEIFKKFGVSKICGSVIVNAPLDKHESRLDRIINNNNVALELRDYYGDFYIPGFHIHPDYIDESIAEMNRMQKNNVNLIGELVPYMDGWNDYSCEAFSLLLNEAGKRNFVVSIHSQGEDEMDKMVREHKDVVFVAAHPGEYNAFMRHIERMKLSENYYLDLSGYGMLRYGMLRRAIDSFGVDRILFGSDYPTCSPGMYIGGVLFDNLLTDTEKEKIFSSNARKILKL